MCLGIFFSQREMTQKLPINPYSEEVHGTNRKNTKKQKKTELVVLDLKKVAKIDLTPCI